MNTRKITIIIGIALFAGAILLFNILSAGPSEEEQGFGNGISAIGVPVIEANPRPISSEIIFTGRVIPEQEVQLFAEVIGILMQGDNAFKSGTSFRKGETILKVDDREFKQSVMNQKSQFQSLLSQVLADINIDYPTEYEIWKAYLEDIELDKDLPSLPESENKQFTLFLTGRSINSTYFAIKQNEIRLAKYTIKAPYDGVLTESFIDVGTLVRANQQLGQFTKTDRYEIEASINAVDRFYINTGNKVEITLDGLKEPIDGTVARINSRIDPTTQTLLVYLRVKNPRILAGQYISGNISGEVFDEAQKIASKSLVRNDLVFIARDSVATIKQIKVMKTAGDSTIVQGFNAGELIIDEFRDAAFEGTKVAPVFN